MESEGKTEKELNSKIIYNSIITPDGTEICSRTTHNYVTHKDANGKKYAVDGGLSYLRRGFDDNDYQENSLTLKDDFKKIRQKVSWGTYGKEGKSPLKFVKIKDLETDHIQNILKDFVENKNCFVDHRFVEIFCRELEFRNLKS